MLAEINRTLTKKSSCISLNLIILESLFYQNIRESFGLAEPRSLIRVKFKRLKVICTTLQRFKIIFELYEFYKILEIP